MDNSDFIKDKAKEWFKKGDSDMRSAEILIRDIEPRYPADIPIYYSIEEAKRAIVLAKDIMDFIKKTAKDSYHGCTEGWRHGES